MSRCVNIFIYLIDEREPVPEVVSTQALRAQLLLKYTKMLMTWLTLRDKVDFYMISISSGQFVFS